MHSRAAMIVSTALLLAAGCSDDRDVPAPATTIVDGAAVFEIQDSTCDDGSSCGWGYYVDEVYFGVECAAPGPNVEPGDIWAVSSDAPFDEVRVVDGFDPHAVSLWHDRDDEWAVCDEESTADGWYLAFGHVQSDAQDEDLARAELRATCTLPAEPARDYCADGGPVFVEDDDGWILVWDPDVVERVNEQIATGEASSHETPHAALEQRLAYAFESGHLPDELRRVCLTEEKADVEGAVRFRVLLQNGGSRRIDHGEELYDIEQLGGGPGWWVVRHRVDESARAVYEGADGRSVADELWERCADHGTVLADLTPAAE